MFTYYLKYPKTRVNETKTGPQLSWGCKWQKKSIVATIFTITHIPDHYYHYSHRSCNNEFVL